MIDRVLATSDKRHNDERSIKHFYFSALGRDKKLQKALGSPNSELARIRGRLVNSARSVEITSVPIR